jgi:hypothetical protein
MSRLRLCCWICNNGFHFIVPQPCFRKRMLAVCRPMVNLRPEWAFKRRRLNGRMRLVKGKYFQCLGLYVVTHCEAINNDIICSFWINTLLDTTFL